MNNFRVLRLLIVMLITNAFAGCGPESYVTAEVRIASPDGQFDAVIQKRDGGATTSVLVDVYVVMSGEKASKSDRVFQAYRMHGDSITWISPIILEIKYEQARIYEFRNFWRLPKGASRYAIEIRETPLNYPNSLSQGDRGIYE